jgi:hypothetical protein
MAKNILISFFLFIAIFTHAQNSSFHLSSTFASKQGSIDKEIAPAVVLRNLTGTTIELRWEIKKTNLSEGWQAVVCDHQCYTSLINSRSFKLEPGEVLHDFKVSFRPNGKEGISSLDVLVYDVNNRKNTEQTITFSAAAQSVQSSSSISTVSKETNAPKVYPNPVVEYMQLQDDYNTVTVIEIYNVVGRKIERFAVNYANEKYDVSALPRGMYMARMLDVNGNIVRTQRISKYAP